jgi:hypothetical protein
VTEDVSLRARFERFPATVKGAFVVRGEDPDPHQIVFLRARVVRVPGSGGHEVPVSTVTLDVPPHRDLFVPFEFPIAEFEPGWYGLEADVEIDGGPRTMPGGKRFCVPWPRGTVRSASVRVDRTVEVGGSKVSIDRCQSGAEGLSLKFHVQPPQPVTVRLFADGSRIDVVEQEVEPSSGKGIARAYPLLKSHEALRIEVGGGGGKDQPAAEIEVPLTS